MLKETGIPATTADNIYMDQLVTVKELNASIESWMQHRYELDVKFDGKEALQQLEKLNLLRSQKLGNFLFFFFFNSFLFTSSFFIF